MNLVDTSSLMSLVRYYLPFDRDGIMLNFIESRFKNRELILIDKVYEECGFVADGLIVTKVPFLKHYPVKTDECLPNTKFFHYANNDFVNSVKRKELKTTMEFEARKTKWLEGADSKLLLYCQQHSTALYPLRIVTEETGGANDEKLFKKIPVMCKTLNLTPPITLPSLLCEMEGIDCFFKNS